MRWTAARRMPWRQRFNRYVADRTAAPAVAQQQNQGPAEPAPGQGAKRRRASGSFSRASKELREGRCDLERWLRRLPRPDERAELLHRAIVAEAATEKAGLIYFVSSFGWQAAEAQAALAKYTPNADRAARWVASDLPLVTACGVQPTVRLFNWAIRALCPGASTPPPNRGRGRKRRTRAQPGPYKLEGRRSSRHGVDAMQGLTVLQVMRALNLRPDRGTFHRLLELCAAAARTQPKPKSGRQQRGEPGGEGQRSMRIAEEIVESHMRVEGLAPEEQTLVLLLRVCASSVPPALSRAQALLEPAALRADGVELSTKLLNGLLAVHTRAADADGACMLLEERFGGDGGPAPDVATYNTCLAACAQPIPRRGRTEGAAARLDRAFGLHARMLERGLAPDVITLSTLLHACSVHYRYRRPAGAIADCEHSDRVVQLYEETVRKGVAPNVATLSALIKALGPEQLPGRVPFILAESVAHGVRLRSFELLQLASRLEEVRTDVTTFAVRDDVREAAAGCLWYMARFSVADQAKGRKALRRLQRLAGERPPPPRLLEQCG